MQPFDIQEIGDRPGADLAGDAGLLECLARGQLGVGQTESWASLWEWSSARGHAW